MNGLLITGAGVWEVMHPPTNPTITLFNVHANVWWGAILLIIGLVYCLQFRPGRAKS